MKMKLNALTLAVAAAGFIGTTAQAADAVLFPYVVNSATVATLVTVVDRATSAGNRYDSAGGAQTGSAGDRLHWRLHYKAGASLTNTSACSEVDGYLPTSPFDIQTVDLGGKFGATTKGVMFNDPGVKNKYASAGVDYMLAPVSALGASRGVLIVHNSNAAAGNAAVNERLYGEAMVLEYATGAAWGYQAVSTDGDAVAFGNGFEFNQAWATGVNGGVTNGLVASNGALTGVLTFMPPADATTTLFVTPMPATAGGALLGADGAADALGYWNKWQTNVMLAASTGVAYDRDETLWSGAQPQAVRCVGAVNLTDLVSSAALPKLVNGGWGGLSLVADAAAPADGSYQPTARGYVIKLEYSPGTSSLTKGTFNNAFIMR